MYRVKILHKYWFSGEIGKGPLQVSIELISKYDLEKNKNIGEKRITCIYNISDERLDKKELSKIETIENVDEIMGKVAALNLKELKNNYFTDKNPERFTYWEIEYDLFKIVGTYDNEINEFKELSSLLELEDIKNFYKDGNAIY